MEIVIEIVKGIDFEIKEQGGFYYFSLKDNETNKSKRLTIPLQEWLREQAKEMDK